MGGTVRMRNLLVLALVVLSACDPSELQQADGGEQQETVKLATNNYMCGVKNAFGLATPVTLVYEHRTAGIEESSTCYVVDPVTEEDLAVGQGYDTCDVQYQGALILIDGGFHVTASYTHYGDPADGKSVELDTCEKIED